jgi:hypothetical protein
MNENAKNHLASYVFILRNSSLTSKEDILFVGGKPPNPQGPLRGLWVDYDLRRYKQGHSFENEASWDLFGGSWLDVVFY